MAILHAVRIDNNRWGVAETPDGECLDIQLPGTFAYKIGLLYNDTIHAPNIVRFFRRKRDLAEAIGRYDHTLAPKSVDRR